ncbi:MAG: hypothetical protein E6Q97_18055 [Desulfurellales bacterium]|nr:MAG: hypothetical protein E6Q97_18055 [Desulfurellales bacterium]
MRTARFIAAILIACVRGWCAPPIVVPPDRAGDLQSALIESGRTGATVELSGVYVITNQLVTSGARIRGTLGSHLGDWNIGGTVLHFRVPPTNGCLRVTQGPTGNASVIENVGLVFYHQTTPTESAVALDGSSYGTVLRRVLIDRPGRGLVFEPAPSGIPRSLGHRLEDITIQSFRTAAIHAPNPISTSDHYLTGLVYLKGQQGADYVTGAVAPATRPVGIDGWPNSMAVDNLLIEDCSVAIRLTQPINGRVKDLFVDNCRGVVFERGPAYGGRHYVKTFRVGILTAAAAEPRCRLATGNVRLEIQTGLQTLTTCRDGASWVNWIPPIK